MTTPSSDVTFEAVRKSFGDVEVLRGFDMHIGAGELVAVLGPSGCGKTTALRILSGFERPTAGRILVGGRDITAVPTNQRGIGMVFQAYSLFPNMTVADNVDYGLRVQRVGAPERRRRVDELLEITGLAALRDRHPAALSGGQQQRVALARAIATRPSVLLLDEPLSALDSIVRVQMRDEIRRLQREFGITSMFVTHDQEEALSMADRVAVVNAGVVEQIDEPQKLYREPRTRFVASFVGTVSEIGVGAVAGDGKLKVLSPGEHLETLLVRPEDLELVPDLAGDYIVTAQSYTGQRTSVCAQAFGDAVGPELVSSVSALDASTVAVGTRVSARLSGQPALRIPPASVRVPSPVA